MQEPDSSPRREWARRWRPHHCGPFCDQERRAQQPQRDDRGPDDDGDDDDGADDGGVRGGGVHHGGFSPMRAPLRPPLIAVIQVFSIGLYATGRSGNLRSSTSNLSIVILPHI